MAKPRLRFALVAVILAAGCFSEIDDVDDPGASSAADAGAAMPEAALTRVCSRPAERACLVWASPPASARCPGSSPSLPRAVGGSAARARVIEALAAASGLSPAAELTLATRLRERAASIAPPEDLDFSPDRPDRAELSKNTFQAWLATRRAALERARAVARRVLRRSEASAVTRARAARLVAGIYADFAIHLETMVVPINVAQGRYAEDATRAYCDALASASEPLWTKTLEAVEQCEKLGPPGFRLQCTKLVIGVGGQRLGAVARKLERSQRQQAERRRAEERELDAERRRLDAERRRYGS
ncbi:MAG: hypothetical protein KJO07_13880, partial [Deltaproteobacteria bacterium]|nr:hypothetical protein [Deltaproteobacteria bacterium]